MRRRKPGPEKTCNTTYPLVLIHGVAWKHQKIAPYWYKIPEYLEARGAVVFVTNQDAWNTHKTRAEQTASEIGTFIQKQQCDKVNLICHSQGSLDARWLIEKLNMTDKRGESVPAKQLIASYTSIAGVHRGSAISDIVTGLVPRKLRPRLSRGLNRVIKHLLRDEDPHVWEAGKELGTQYMREVFNKECPLVESESGDGVKDGIYYQSYATRMRFGAFLSLCPGDRLYLPTWLILKSMEGDNDGMVSVESAKFGRFRGVKAGVFFGPGVNHLAQINQLLGLVCFFNPKKWIAEIVTDLKSLGY